MSFKHNYDILMHFITTLDIMSGLEKQETAEYYNWLLHIEAQEFERELLEIVSNNFYNCCQIKNHFIEIHRHGSVKINFIDRDSNGYYSCLMRWPRS